MKMTRMRTEVRIKETRAWPVVTMMMNLRSRTMLRIKTIKAAALAKKRMKINLEMVEKGVSWTKMAYTRLRN